MNTEEQNDPVWELLGKARRTKASPAFLRDVLREVKAVDGGEEEYQKQGRIVRGFFGSRQMRRVLAVAAAVAVIVVAGVAVFSDRAVGTGEAIVGGTGPEGTPAEMAETDFLTAIDGSISDEIGEIEYVDDLLAVQDPLLLSDADIAMLLY